MKRGQKSKGAKHYSTAPLHSHMKRCHAKEYNAAYVELEKITADNVNDSSPHLTPKERKLKEMKVQITLLGCFQTKKIWTSMIPGLKL